MSAELAARRTAAAAVLADYAEACTGGADVADRALWAARLADMLAYVLDGLGAEDGAAIVPPGEPAAMQQLEEIRLVLEAFDWETDDRQYALEQIDQIVSGRDDLTDVHRGDCPEGTWHFRDPEGNIFAAHPDGTAHVARRSQQ